MSLAFRFKNIQSYFSFFTLTKAYYKCRKHKRLKSSTANFEYEMEKNIIEIEKELVLQTYKSSSFSVFVVTEPKTREVFAAEFKDRVVHHLLTDYLQPYFEPKFIHHSYACRNEKGTHMAVKSLGKLIKKITKNNTQKAYYLQADVKSFFPSINHNILFNLIKNKVKNPYFIWLTQNIIYFDCTINPTKKGQLSLFAKVPPHKSLFTVPKGKGLPIGNLTSQFFANVYLNELDQFVKHKLKCKYYIRYVDDFIIMSQNKNELFVIKHKIETFLHEKLDLELHPNKWKVEDVRNGIDTLGYITKPNYKLVRKRVIKSLKRKLYEYQSSLDQENSVSNTESLEKIVACINSYYAHFKHANSYKLRKTLWEKHFGDLKHKVVPVDNFRYFKIK